MDYLGILQDFLQMATTSPAQKNTLKPFIHKLENLGWYLEHYQNQGVYSLVATKGKKNPNLKSLGFIGHLDTVPRGQGWKFNDGIIDNGNLYGRGAADMKGAIVAFLKAADCFHNRYDNLRTTMFLGGDEELTGEYGIGSLVKKIVEDCDFIIGGEPTNPEYLGQEMKIGRRGSLNFELTINMPMKHVAYTEILKFHEPVDVLFFLLNKYRDMDPEVHKFFPPSKLTVTKMEGASPANNQTINSLKIRANIRFNSFHTSLSLIDLIKKDLELLKVDYELKILESCESFFNNDQAYTNLAQQAHLNIFGKEALLSTSGGTSDCRFVAQIVPTIEYGLVNKTIHKVDENFPVEDFFKLSDFYLEIMDLIKNL